MERSFGTSNHKKELRVAPHTQIVTKLIANSNKKCMQLIKNFSQHFTPVHMLYVRTMSHQY